MKVTVLTNWLIGLGTPGGVTDDIKRQLTAGNHAMSPVLYLDFDGVLHPAAVWLKPENRTTPVLEERYAGEHALFEHSRTLKELLAPYPEVRLVLSTAWVLAYGIDYAASCLPGTLQARVIGSTFDIGRDGAHFTSVARGYQVVADAKRRGLRNWIALDDDVRDWPKGQRRRLIATDPVHGLASPLATQALARWLESTAQ